MTLGSGREVQPGFQIHQTPHAFHFWIARFQSWYICDPDR